jgi:hypothetical protein
MLVITGGSPGYPAGYPLRADGDDLIYGLHRVHAPSVE